MRSALARWLTVVLPAALVATVAVLVTGGTPAAADDQLAARQAALALARQTGVPVTIDALTTENVTEQANPDGNFTAEVHLAPVRVRNGTGAWQPVDLSLAKRSDGSVAPGMHPRGLVLSGAQLQGTHSLARLSQGGEVMGLMWQGALPAPTLNGTRAVYPQVRPGVDLIIDVTRTGFELSFVVADRTAADTVGTLRMPIETAGLTTQTTPDGGLEFVDATGASPVSMPAAQVWDATLSAATGESLHHATVDVTVVNGTDLVLVPNTSFLDSPDVRYPVTFDPSFTWKPTFDAFVQTGYTSDQSGKTELKLGYSDDGGSWKARSFLRWDGVSSYWNARVLSATLSLYETWSWSCTAASWEAWRTDNVTSSVRWTAQPTFREKVGASTQTKGYSSSCGDGWVGVDVAKAFQTGFTNHLASVSIGLKATSETNHSGWKRFDSTEATHDPYVSITYDRPPYAPATSGMVVQGKACGTGASAAHVSTTAGAPTLQARIADPDGAERPLVAHFYVAEVGRALPASAAVSSAAVTGSTTGNNTTPVAVPATFPQADGSTTSLQDGHTYYFQARADDKVAIGPNSGSCEFIVDNPSTDKPPTVVSADNVYPLFGSGGGPGVSGKFTFSVPAATLTVSKYRYSVSYNNVQQTAPTEIAPSATNGSVTVTLTPPFDGLNSTVPLALLNQGGSWVITVEMFYPTLNRWSSKQTVYRTAVAPVAAPVAHWKMDDPASSTTLTDALGHFNATRHGSMVKSTEDFGDGGSSWTFNGTNVSGGAANEDYADLSSPIDTSRAFTMAVWVRLADKTANRNFLSTTGNGGNFYMLYHQSDDTWDIAVPVTDASGTVTGWTHVTSTSKPQVGVWTHIAATFDPAGGAVSLYVNGTRERTVTGVSISYVATGRYLRIGMADVDYFHGELDDIVVWQRAVDPRELGALASAERGSWDLDVALFGAITPSDASVPFDLNAYEGTSPVAPPDPSDPVGSTWWGAGHNTGDSGAVVLGNYNGAARTLQTDVPVIRTDQSFSVSAWIHLDAIPAASVQTFLSQDGVYRSGFFLGLRPNSSGAMCWMMVMHDADNPNSGATQSLQAPVTAAQVGQDASDNPVYVHLVTTFDANAQRFSLYLNGVLQGSVQRTARWQANGAFAIGRALWTAAGQTQAHVSDQATGVVDEVRVFQGVLTPDMVSRLYRTIDGVL